MGKDTKIEWCDHTFNPWRGCVKISEGCEHCYAEAQSKRNPAVLGEWGSNARRAFGARGYLENPFKWSADAHVSGTRLKVFCGSLMDVWEYRHDLHQVRAKMLDTIAETPNLDWLLLSKRPEMFGDCLLAALPHCSDAGAKMVRQWYAAAVVVPMGHQMGLRNMEIATAPRNVWVGVTVENQRRAQKRCVDALAVPAPVHFVSAEPLLDMPDLVPYLAPGLINWVICGGESGAKARPFNSDWARCLLDQCGDAGVPFFMKQLGDNADNGAHDGGVYLKEDQWRDIPKDLRVRQFPIAAHVGG